MKKYQHRNKTRRKRKIRTKRNYYKNDLEITAGNALLYVFQGFFYVYF